MPGIIDQGQDSYLLFSLAREGIVELASQHIPNQYAIFYCHKESFLSIKIIYLSGIKLRSHQCLILIKFHTFDRIASKKHLNGVIRQPDAGWLYFVWAIAKCNHRLIFSFFLYLVVFVVIRSIHHETAD